MKRASILTLGVCVVLGELACAQDIFGVISDSKKSPIKKVTVELYPSSPRDAAQMVETDVDGKYSFKAPKFSAAFDIIYSHSQFDDSVVSRLSENKPQEINKTLYKKGEQRVAVELLDSLQALERIHVMAIAAKEETAMMLRKHLERDAITEVLSNDKQLGFDEPAKAKEFVLGRQKALRNLLLGGK